MNKYIPVIVFVLLNFQIIAQSAQHDSLKQVIKNANTVEIEIDTYLKLAKLYLRANPDSCRLIATQALEISTKKDYEKGKADCLHLIGNSHYKSSKVEALRYYNESLEIRKKIIDKEGI